MRLENKVAIVTGGGRGIGKNIALAYAREGADVVVAARTKSQIEAAAEEIRGIGRESLAVQTAVDDYEAVERLVERALEKFARIDVLVNNAGVQGPIGPVAGSDRTGWISSLMVNLVGVYHCCRAVLPSMMEHRRGKIINLSGGGSVYPRPYFSAYSAAKAGVARFTETLAEEVRPYHIQVNTLAPGGSPTAMLRQIAGHPGEAGEAEARRAKEILDGGGVDRKRQAALAVFLASDESDGLTGRMLHTNEDWPSFADHIEEIMATDLYTVRRIQP